MIILNMLPYTMMGDEEEEDGFKTRKREYKPTNGIIEKIGILLPAILKIKWADDKRRENLPSATWGHYDRAYVNVRHSLGRLEVRLVDILDVFAFHIDVVEMREDPLHEMWHDEGKEGLLRHAMQDTYETYQQHVKDAESVLIDMSVVLGLENKDNVGYRLKLLSRFKY